MKTLYCNVFGHKYHLSKQITNHVSEYKCNCCERELTTNSDGGLIELTAQYKDINNVLSKIYSNKMIRRKTNILATSGV